jgi:pimeloyl-ACP methyl ester carboxylesterase
LSLPSIEDFKLAGPIPPAFMPGFTLLDWYHWDRGRTFTAKYLRGPDGPMVQRDLASLGFEFAIPMIFIEGDEDYMTPSAPAEDYFRRIVAPRKDFAPIRGGDHFIPFDRPDAFLSELVARVRPLAVPPDTQRLDHHSK